MSGPARDHSEADPAIERQGPAAGPGVAAAPAVARVLALQRSAGNHVTAAFLARQDGGAGTADAGTAPAGGVGDLLTLITERRWDEAVRRLQTLSEADLVTELRRVRRVDLDPLRDRAGALGAEFLRVRDAAESERVRQLAIDWERAVADGNWQEAVTLVQAYNDIDLPLKLDALSLDQINALCQQADRMLPAYARTRRAAEPIRIRKLIAAYDAAVAAADWPRAALLLNAFNDTDIAARVDALPAPALALMRSAAQPHTGSWGARVVQALNRRLVSDQMQGMADPAAPTRAKWDASGNDPTATDFSGWAMAPSEPPAFNVAPTTVINCWEMVLYAAYRAGAIDWRWINRAYMDAAPDWFAGLARRLTPRGTQTYDRATKRPQPRRGDIVLFDGVDHVALATGAQGADGTHVWSFWVRPGTGTHGSLVSVMDTTIEALLPACDLGAQQQGRPRAVITFGAPPW
jgi:hypothetical protein